MRSLRLRLFVLLIAATALVWTASAMWTYLSTRADVQRVLDRRLMEAAGMVASLVESSEGAIRASSPAMGRLPPAPHAAGYSRQLSCQIWTLDWRLVGRSGSAPAAPLAQGRPGFSERLIEGEQWRVYTMIEPRLGLRILVGDNLRVRRNLVGDVLTGLLLPAVVGLLALGLLIWSAVGQGLAPLRRVARELARRDPSDTRPLTVSRPDAELRPLVEAVNGLFVRLEHLRVSERHFVASAAHELQTPLAGLKAHAQIALSAPEEAIREKSLRSIQASVDRTSRLVQQLLDLSREEADAEPMRPRWIRLGRAVGAIADEFSELLRSQNVRLLVDHEAGLAEIHIDEAGLALVLRNLVKNAVEHSSPGSQVRITLERCGDWAEVAITDEGPGIPASELPHIRDRFVRGSRARGSGSGLGLSIVQLVLERSAATLELRNRSQGGLSAAMRLRSDVVRRAAQPVTESISFT